mgnify:CR=1 FL=1
MSLAQRASRASGPTAHATPVSNLPGQPYRQAFGVIGARIDRIVRGLLDYARPRDEGLRLKPYRCTADKLSLGYGRNLDDVGISEDEAEYLLANDIRRVVAELYNALPWFSALPELWQRALANMAFQM